MAARLIPATTAVFTIVFLGIDFQTNPSILFLTAITRNYIVAWRGSVYKNPSFHLSFKLLCVFVTFTNISDVKSTCAVNFNWHFEFLKVRRASTGDGNYYRVFNFLNSYGVLKQICLEKFNIEFYRFHIAPASVKTFDCSTVSAQFNGVSSSLFMAFTSAPALTRSLEYSAVLA